MAKIILISIYIFGLCCQITDIKKIFENYKYGVKKSIVWIWLLQIIIWPVFWLRSFIMMYLNYYQED